MNRTPARDPRLAATTDDRSSTHSTPGFHPERPERLAAARRGLDAAVPDPIIVPARSATADELARVHSDGYIHRLESALATGRGQIDADTYFSPGTHDAAWFAAGGACALVDALLDGRADVGTLLVRPPGHHATPDRAMGFCLLNNVAIAAAHARARGLRSIAIVDWDVHHGNGTQAAFERDPSVLFVSMHQWPLYPGTGAAEEVGRGDAVGRTVNIPLPGGSTPGTYAAAFERIVLPVLAEARPELILVSAGFDAHERDPLGGMQLTAGAYGWMASRLRETALTLGHGRVAMFLEGGYDLPALEQSVAAAARGLIAPVAADSIRAVPHDAEGEAALELALRTQRPFWKSVL